MDEDILVNSISEPWELVKPGLTASAGREFDFKTTFMISHPSCDGFTLITSSWLEQEFELKLHAILFLTEMGIQIHEEMKKEDGLKEAREET